MATQSINDVAIHYEEKGSGPLLVLLHGFPLDLRMWAAQVEELSSRWHVLAPDFRGFGQSAADGPFTVPSLADDIHALVARRKCVLAGLSMGGYVAMNVARRYPDDLLGLILVDTKDAADTAEQRDYRDRMIEVVRAKGSAAIAEMMAGKMLSPDTLEHRPAQVKALRSMMESCPPQTIEYALEALRDRPDMTEELPKISVPTLIVVGDADAITPPGVAEGMQKKIPGSQLAVIKGAGHMSPMEQPTQVNRVMGRFLKGVARAARP
jgi:pimeloyl-ACP methyl ester carboxylesterase